MAKLGDMYFRIQVWRKTPTETDAFGQVQPASEEESDSRLTGWSIVPTGGAGNARWASRESISGKEFWQGQQVTATVTEGIRMRSDSDLAMTPADRLKDFYSGEVFEIVSVLDDGTWVQVQCRQAM